VSKWERSGRLRHGRSTEAEIRDILARAARPAYPGFFAYTVATTPNEPVIYRTLDRQCEVINGQQVLVGADTAWLYYQILEPARIFNEIDGLIHAAYAQNRLTALLNQYVLQQAPSQPITARQLEQLCAGRSRKSTLNNRKSALGYTDANLGCKTTQPARLRGGTRRPTQTVT